MRHAWYPLKSLFYMYSPWTKSLSQNTSVHSNNRFISLLSSESLNDIHFLWVYTHTQTWRCMSTSTYDKAKQMWRDTALSRCKNEPWIQNRHEGTFERNSRERDKLYFIFIKTADQIKLLTLYRKRREWRKPRSPRREDHAKENWMKETQLLKTALCIHTSQMHSPRNTRTHSLHFAPPIFFVVVVSFSAKLREKSPPMLQTSKFLFANFIQRKWKETRKTNREQPLKSSFSPSHPSRAPPSYAFV